MELKICEFGPILVMLYLFCISEGSLVTLYGKQNFQGSSVNLNLFQDNCKNIQDSLSSGIGSINTHGSCVLGWLQQNCAGNTQKLLLGTPSNFGLQTSNGTPPGIKSISLCSTNINGNNAISKNQIGADLWKTAANEHNKYRKRHNAQFLKSDDQKINRIAQNYADYLANSNVFEHSQNSRQGYGENLAWTTRAKNQNDAVKEAVKNWYAEEKYYNYNRPGFSSKTGHFTALVWKNTKIVGIGVAWSTQKRWWVIVANYFPAGNVQNQFGQNVQKPS